MSIVAGVDFTELEEAIADLRAENEKLNAEAERRFDCHGDPANCGACVSCLLRDLEFSRGEVEQMKACLSDEAEENCRIADRIGITEAIRGGKSYSDAEVELFDNLKGENEKLKSERDEARAYARVLVRETQTLTCVYCGQSYPPGTPTHGSETLTEHIRICGKHPMREIERQLSELRALALALVDCPDPCHGTWALIDQIESWVLAQRLPRAQAMTTALGLIALFCGRADDCWDGVAALVGPSAGQAGRGVMVGETVELKSLLGNHVLSGAQENAAIKIRANSISFILDGRCLTAVEDPDDGYRSCLGKILVGDRGLVKNVFDPVEVVGVEGDKYTEAVKLVSVKTGKIILEVGTNLSDSYYPDCVMRFTPENLDQNSREVD